MDRWKPMSPYLGGLLTGLLIIASVLVAGKYFGASTSYVRTAGMLEQTVAPEHVASLGYYQKEQPIVEWQWMFVLGIMIGSFIASRASGAFELTGTPSTWRERFGPSPIKRGLVAFFGGAIALFGARLAGGCPSGHGLSGGLQLAVSGYIALVCFFIGGLIMARIVYKGR